MAEFTMGLRDWARSMKRDTIAVYLAARDPRVPWYAKALAFAVAGYALSPIDLIPDFIPVIGYLDDVIIVPLGIILVRRMIPSALFDELRVAANEISDRPVSRAAAAVIVALWCVAVLMAVWRFWPRRAVTPP